MSMYLGGGPANAADPEAKRLIELKHKRDIKQTMAPGELEELARLESRPQAARAAAAPTPGPEGPYRWFDFQGGRMRAPNPEWGRANGYVWDEQRGWRPRSSEDDIREQVARMQLERQQWENQRAREEHQRERLWQEEDRRRRQAQEDFERQQAQWVWSNKQNILQSGDASVMMDSDGDGISNDGRRMAGSRPPRAPAAPPRNYGPPRLWDPPTAAQPVMPPSYGTPYAPAAQNDSQPQPGQSPFPGAHGFKPPAPGSRNLAVMEWWHNPATGEEMQATKGSTPPPGWVKGRKPQPTQVPTNVAEYAAMRAKDGRMNETVTWRPPGDRQVMF